MTVFIKQRKLLFLELLFLFLLSLTPLLWFKQDEIVIGLDSGYPVDYIGYFQQRSFTWLASQNFGVDMSAEVGVVPYNSFPALIRYIGVSQDDVQKVLFVSWFLIILLASYSFVAYFFSKKEQWIIRLAGCVIYAFSLHLYSFWLQGEQPILASYAIMPLFTLFLLRFARGESSALRIAIYINLVYVFLSSGGVRGVPLIGPVIITGMLVFLYYFVVNYPGEKLHYIKRFVVLGGLSVVLFIFCNAYFLLPFLSSFAIQYRSQVAIAGGISGAIDWAKFISTHTSFVNLFRLHGDNSWYHFEYLWSNAYLTNPLLIIYSFLFPVLSFLAPIVTKKKKERILILFFVLLALVGLFFSAGTHPPFGFLYVLMMEWVPGFAAYRSAYYKFMPIVYLSFSMLVGVSLYYMLNKIPKKYRFLVGIICISSLLLYHYPYFTNSNFAFNKPFSTMVKIPDYVHEFARMQQKSPDLHRTLVVPPPTEAFNIKTYQWGYWSSYPIFPLITDRGFVVNDAFVYNENENVFITSIYNNLRKKDFESFNNGAKIAAIKYVLLTKDVASDYSMSVSENPSIYGEILEGSKNFHKVWEKGQWILYEITQINPSKITASHMITLNNGGPTSIDNILRHNTIPFVNADSSEDATVQNLSINGEIVDYVCASCHVLNDQFEPFITKPYILPTSFLYTLKLRLENDLVNAKNTDQKIDAFLGLSLKRVSELDTLNYDPIGSEREWLKSSELLFSYWQNIDELYEKEYKNSIRYDMFRKISRYATLERNIVHNIIMIRGLDSTNLFGKSLMNGENMIKKLQGQSNKKLDEHDWRTTFVYDISNSPDTIYLNTNSLPKGINNEPVLPSRHEINSTLYESTNNKDEKSPRIVINESGKKILTLFFDDVPNLFSDIHEEDLKIDGKVRQCLLSDIKNYRGNQKYLITANVAEKNIGTMYIKRSYNIFKTQHDPYPTGTQDFNPDLSIETYTGSKNIFNYQFTGRPNDKSARVYFCTNSKDPKQVFNGISVLESVQPEIYSLIEKENTSVRITTDPPQVSYKKINPTKYVVKITNATSPYILSFSERFSPLWILAVENNNEEIGQQFMINGFANAWQIDKLGDYDLTIVFKTQRVLGIGLIITTATLVLLGGFLLLRFVYYVKNKN